jgi:two-component system, NtrC family, nitrogen regulation sensor histidine kinase NtrY
MNVALQTADAATTLERISLSRIRKRWVQRLFWLTSIALVVLLAVAFLHISGSGAVQMNPRYITILVLGTLLLLLVLGIMVVRDAYHLWQRTKTGVTGTRLQRRIFTMFCAVSILPTFIVTLFSVLFFNVGVRTWFDDQVTRSMSASVTVAKAYLEEHKSAIRSDAIWLAGDIRSHFPNADTDMNAFQALLTQLATERNLSEAIVFEPSRVLARTALSFSLIFERLPEKVLERADETHVVVMSQNNDKIQGVIRLSALPEIYLLVSRTVDPTVIGHMKAARESAMEYGMLQHEMGSMQLQFLSALCMLALLLFLASTWAGMRLAVRIIGPISSLNSATERVRAGDYSIRVAEGPKHDEIANLARTFNRMTSQLETQRRDLLEANRMIDERRRFSETVLSGVSAGVLALSADHAITLCNRSALKLLGHEKNDDLLTMQLADLLPETAGLLAQATENPDKTWGADVTIGTPHGTTTLHVRVTAERNAGDIEGFIVTFDDITPLVKAQRNAAWSDVARRIAHEIKNPLTPITLATERLKKKYSEQITHDSEGYARYLETISRHVRDIGSMVEEFVGFARLPTAVMKEENISMLVRKVVFSEHTVHPDIRYDISGAEAPILLICDERLLGQALLNVLKNAAEALENNESKSEKILWINLVSDSTSTRITVHDSGPGFPPDKLGSLTEPYVTTRAKGTGLGLAIVKKTIEEHGGSLSLYNHPEGGAVVEMQFSHKN